MNVLTLWLFFKLNWDDSKKLTAFDYSKALNTRNCFAVGSGPSAKAETGSSEIRRPAAAGRWTSSRSVDFRSDSQRRRQRRLRSESASACRIGRPVSSTWTPAADVSPPGPAAVRPSGSHRRSASCVGTGRPRPDDFRSGSSGGRSSKSYRPTVPDSTHDSTRRCDCSPHCLCQSCCRMNCVSKREREAISNRTDRAKKKNELTLNAASSWSPGHI